MQEGVLRVLFEMHGQGNKPVCLVLEKATRENVAYVQTGKALMRIVFIQTSTPK